MSVHYFFRDGEEWGEYAHPRVGIEKHLARDLAKFERRGELDTISIFMSSTTDPYQGLERTYGLTRLCLEAFVHRPPGLLVIQTRSPLVERDFDLIASMGERCCLNFTLETDRDDVRRLLTPRCPSIERRIRTLQRARETKLNVQVTVSPCLPYSDVETFGTLLLELASHVIVDSFVTGDGSGGKRTAGSPLPSEFDKSGLGDWRSVEAARALYEWLETRIGERAGWSADGFTRLARNLTSGDCL